MEQRRHYYAFISHSSKDEKTALWLRDKLVNYNIPASVQKEYNAPKRLRPVFVYQTDLAGNVLSEALNKELQDSQYLIIVCSPDGAKSEYVNGEAQHFIDTGRADKIIPFIVDGTPHAKNPDEECFPPALLELAENGIELRGVDLKEQTSKLGSKMAAVVNVIATMLGVRFDSMWDIYKRKQRKRNIVYSCLAVFLIALSLFVWDYKRPTYRYYADYVDTWGVPEGVLELTKEQVSHRNCCYQFEYRRVPFGEPNAYSWRVVKVSYVNSALQPQKIKNTALNDRSPVLEIEYNSQTGVVSRQNYCDANGKVQIRHNLTERNGVQAAVADFVAPQEQKGAGFVDIGQTGLISVDLGLDVFNNHFKANIVRFVYERDAQGHIVKQTFHSSNDRDLSRSAVNDGNGIFGYRFELDSLGRRIKTQCIGIDGENTQTNRGVGSQCFEYDGYGNIATVSYFNNQGNLVYNEEMWAVSRGLADEQGNIVEVGYFAPNGEPCLYYEGYSMIRDKYDDTGNLIERSYYGTNHQLCMTNNGYSIERAKYDRLGRVIDNMYFDTDNQPCYSDEGIARWTSKYDRHGNDIERRCYGTDGMLCLCNQDYAIVKAEYDKNGNVVKVATFGVDGAPCAFSGSASSCVSKYDDDGNLVENTFFDPKGRPCMDEEGVAKVTHQYDDRGNAIENAYYGKKGTPCLQIHGYSKVVASFNDNGLLLETEFFGTDGLPCISDEGYSKMCIAYDEKGQNTGSSYFDAEGNPCRMRGWGFHRIEHVCDEHGAFTEINFYDENGEPCLVEEGYSKLTVGYDDFGNISEARYYDQDGKPCCRDGVHIMHLSYDSRRNIISHAFYRKDGSPGKENVDYVMDSTWYDDRNRPIALIYYDITGKACLTNEGMAGFTRSYDERGNNIESVSLGIDGQPCMSMYGYAKEVNKYDDKDNCIETAYYDVDGNPCLNEYGYFRVENVYKNNDVINNIYYDSDDNVIINLYKTMYFKEVLPDGCAAEQGVPANSVVLKWNNWEIGSSWSALWNEFSRSNYGEKDVVVLTPEMEIIHLFVDSGKLDVVLSDMSIDESQIDEWKPLYEEWKAKEFPDGF